jgi:hypothetical protein
VPAGALSSRCMIIWPCGGPAGPSDRCHTKYLDPTVVISTATAGPGRAKPTPTATRSATGAQGLMKLQRSGRLWGPAAMGTEGPFPWPRVAFPGEHQRTPGRASAQRMAAWGPNLDAVGQGACARLESPSRFTPILSGRPSPLRFIRSPRTNLSQRRSVTRAPTMARPRDLRQ